MKTLVFHEASKYEIEEKQKPTIKNGEILLKVIACGICGSDLRIFKHGHHALRPPITTGHEIVGEVVETGAVDNELKKGDKVIVVTPVGCTKCKYCRKGMHNMCPWVANDVHSIGYYCDGGFAEFVLIPQEAVEQKVLIKIPDTDIDLRDFVLCEPLSCVINGQEKLKIEPGESVAVFGAGPIGCMHVLLVKAKGAGKVVLIDLDKKKLDLAKKNNIPADAFVEADKIDIVEYLLSETDRAGVDISIVAAPSGKAQEQAIKSTGILGRVSLFGGLPKTEPTINFPSNMVHYKEIEVYGAFASNHRHYEMALSLIINKQIDTKSLVTHYMSLDQIHEAVEKANSGEAIKISIIP